MMKKVYLLAGSILIIDLLLYLFLFHSGIVLPLINPSVEEYNALFTSFPRDTSQKNIWLMIHWPTFLLFKEKWDLIFLSVIQYPLIIICFGIINKKPMKSIN
ncbi:MAG: hypothetical protein GY705_19110 [Bacteroidetes bacterium]|nr:hypothetical protein [Bacteroidota bacterium]